MMNHAVQTADPLALHPEIFPGEHLICRLTGNAAGPTFLAIGSLHGNEPAGDAALRRVANRLYPIEDQLKGRVVFLTGNTRALSAGVRFIDADLNRHWSDANVARNRGIKPIDLSEDLEQQELLAIVDELLATAKDEVFALDLHSTSATGMPFATVGDTMRNRRFAQSFPVTILLGIEEQLDGTLLEFLNNLGVITIGFEAGQHTSETTVANHEAFVWNGLVTAGLIDADLVTDLRAFRTQLAPTSHAPRIVEVRYRHAISPEDEFRMEPGFENFEPVRRGQHIASDRGGAVYATESGLMLMPLYQKLGEDGFFIGREVSPFWFRLSAALRRLKVGDLIHILPGVHRLGEDNDVLEIDTSVARFFPLQIFHLLGFRKRRWQGDKLIVTRRKFDTAGPFRK